MNQEQYKQEEAEIKKRLFQLYFSKKILLKQDLTNPYVKKDYEENKRKLREAKHDLALLKTSYYVENEERGKQK